MSEPAHPSDLRSKKGSCNKIHIAATPTRIVLDVAGCSYDSFGRPHCDRALIGLSLSNARRLNELLQQVINTAEDADPWLAGLWPDATRTVPVHPRRRNNVVHLYAVREAVDDPLTIPPRPPHPFLTESDKPRPGGK
ncbi:MAG: hypothetical protein ACJ8AW_19175 [Rhodopila sp.]